jgi:hypothetical protein
MALSDFILGRHLASEEDKDERVGPMAGISVFGLDELSSVAYGPEAALTVLIPLGIAGIGFSLPITVAVSTILTIVYFSCRQTIAGCPQGAGSACGSARLLKFRVELSHCLGNSQIPSHNCVTR